LYKVIYLYQKAVSEPHLDVPAPGKGVYSGYWTESGRELAAAAGGRMMNRREIAEIERSGGLLVKEPNDQPSNNTTTMKKIIALLATALFAASVYAGEFADISPTDVLAAANAKSAVIIDANPSDSYQAGHVPGALSWAAIKDNLAANLPADKGALIIAYCGNPKCGAYAAAAVAAKHLGYTNIKHMSAGIAGWNAAKLPTEAGK
jgi:rhodanese-related sulfurtransferase